MRSWYMLMAAFIAILAIMAFLLGRMETPARQAAGAVISSSSRISGGPALRTSPCPWQLEAMSIREMHDTPEIDLQEKAYVSIRDRTGSGTM